MAPNRLGQHSIFRRMKRNCSPNLPYQLYSTNKLFIDLIHSFSDTISRNATIRFWWGDGHRTMLLVFCANCNLFAHLQTLCMCTPTIPLCSDADWDKYETLLDIPSLLLLNHQLPVELRRQWKILYTTRSGIEANTAFTNYYTKPIAVNCPIPVQTLSRWFRTTTNVLLSNIVLLL